MRLTPDLKWRAVIFILTSSLSVRPDDRAPVGLGQHQLGLHEQSGVDVAGVVGLKVTKHRADNIQLRQPEIQSGQGRAREVGHRH